MADARRLVVITGARQVGKTTLVQSLYPELRYVNLDAIENREALRGVPTAAWARTVGPAIIDEAQKEPGVFERVKYAYDAGEINFSVLTGSSRFLLMDRVRETLAGRAFVYELWPLMASELAAPSAVPPPAPLLSRLLRAGGPVSDTLAGEPAVLLGEEDAWRRAAMDHLALWGGMPELVRLTDPDRRQWLRSYTQTFLERDLADLASLSQLQPFATLQRLVMARTGQLLSYAELGRDAGIGASTARRYLEYLRVSYQALLLPPFHRNVTSTLVKSPKVLWVDAGLMRQGLNQWGPLTGEQFETLVIVEIHKWISTMAEDARLSFYRTRSGAEVDLLLETAGGILGVEIKRRDRVAGKDTRMLRRLAEELGDAWRGGLVVYRGATLERLDAAGDVWAVPAHRLVA